MRPARALEWRFAPHAVLAAALVVRLVWALSRPEQFTFPDSGRYHGVARNIASGRGIVVNRAYAHLLPGGRDDVEVYHAHSDPGYSVFLAGLYSVGLDSRRAVRAMQALLDTATVILVMLLAQRLFGRRAAVAAGSVAALEPLLVFFTGMILTEVLFTLLLTGSLVALAASRRTAAGGDAEAKPSDGSGGASRARGLLAAGAWGALAAAGSLVKSAFFMFLPLVAVADVVIAPGPERRARLRCQLLALAVWAAVLAPWAIRNAVLLGEFVPTTTRNGIALYGSLAPDATGGWDPCCDSWPAEEMAPLGEVGRAGLLRRRAWESAAANPLRTVGLVFVKEARLWSPVPWARAYRKARYWAVGIASFVLLVGAAAVGAVLGRRDWRRWWPALAPGAYLTILMLVFAGSVRYRVPAHAALAVLAGAFYARVFGRSAPDTFEQGCTGCSG
ncbi:MAG: glycosyltransferase family 39 protein [Planctomycetota bacterium]